tara:strand:- start:880 stop:1146 length:267 start_codon:yes stop_codon:yes gene_type:complete
MDYNVFLQKLIELGFDVDNFEQLPYLREEYPQMIVSWIGHPLGVQLKIRERGDALFRNQRVEYFDMYGQTIQQIEYNIKLAKEDGFKR